MSAPFDPTSEDRWDRPWTQACRYADAVAEEGGIEHATERAGVDIAELAHVAEQRALRALMLHTGRLAELQATAAGNPTPIALTANESQWLMIATALAMDGLFIGWRARMLSERREEEET